MTLPCGCNYNLGVTCILCNLTYRAHEARKAVDAARTALADAHAYDLEASRTGDFGSRLALAGARARVGGAEDRLAEIERAREPLQRAYDAMLARL